MKFGVDDKIKVISNFIETFAGKEVNLRGLTGTVILCSKNSIRTGYEVVLDCIPLASPRAVWGPDFSSSWFLPGRLLDHVDRNKVPIIVKLLVMRGEDVEIRDVVFRDGAWWEKEKQNKV